ncbi:MAG TPA: alpha/beta hydrolase [Chloroflexota bacterium]|nr:alpha/beta hydrolase [Chloroflexota bacterium]
MLKSWRDERVAVEGFELAVHVTGSGPVVLVHPGGPGLGWEYLRLAVLEGSVTTVYLEPIGTGSSTRLADAGYSLDLDAALVHGLIEKLGRGPVWLLGHSYGGFVALRCALDHPEDLLGLVLYDTAPTNGPDFWDEAWRNLARVIERHADQPGIVGVKRLRDEPPADATDDDLAELVRDALPAYFADYWGRKAEFGALGEAIRVYGSPFRHHGPPFDVRPDLPSIEVPILIIVGRHDFICPPRWSELMHAAIPGSQLVVLEQSGHFGHIEEPDAFAAAVANFTR